MSLNLKGKSGISIKLITGKINKEAEKEKTQNRKKRKVKTKYRTGTLVTDDWKNIAMGLGIMSRLTNETFRMQNSKLLSGKQDVSKFKKEIIGYKFVMDDFLRKLRIGAEQEYNIRKRTDSLLDYTKISQAARDGLILKQDRRQEIVDGQPKEITYDTTMAPREVINVLIEYERQANKLQFEKLDNYLGLGLGLAGIVGSLLDRTKSEEQEHETAGLVTLGTTVIAVLKLMQGMRKQSERETQMELEYKQFRMREDLLENEPISNRAEEECMKDIGVIAEQERKICTKIRNKDFLFNVSVDLANAIISGMYINKHVKTKENGKLDGKSLAEVLVSLQSTKGISGNFIKAVQGFQYIKKQEEEFQEIGKKVQEILTQMEDKVYPLKGAKEPFNSIEIKDFKGRFYPKKNYETGEKEYATIIHIPEFSMERGDVVLLSGESGAGKSTFLRLLKRGDINNRDCIKLHNGQIVDNLGDQYISFRPNTNLGNERSVLAQITGKQSISELDKKERQNLITILQELKLDSQDILEQLACKKFMEFSTGQQRRLALSKLFYRIDDGASAIIVDEPVGNVEDKLIREQLEKIKEYAKNRKVMLIITTHRLELAEDLATKRYHINQDGVLEKLSKVKEEQEERD